jgi:hypothetical protein
MPARIVRSLNRSTSMERTDRCLDPLPSWPSLAADNMNVMTDPSTPLYSQPADAGSEGLPQNREGLALVLLNRITQAEGGEPSEGFRTYTLDLLREILLTIDGKRTPPITFAGTDRRAMGIERRAI